MATAPEPVFEQTPKSWTLGELFEYSRERRSKKQFTRFICEEGRGLDENELEFRIPQHQRFPQWPTENIQKLIDSVFRGLPIQGFQFKENNDHETGRSFYSIEDGQSRLTYLQRFYNNQIKFNGVKFNDFDAKTKERFENYKINVIIVEYVGPEEEEDMWTETMFQRLQEGVPLSDSDRVAAHPRSTTNKRMFQLTKEDVWKYGGDKYFNWPKSKEQQKKRYADMAGIISTLATNDPEYITTVYKKLCKQLECDISLDLYNERIIPFIQWYIGDGGLLDSVYKEKPLSSDKRSIKGKSKKENMRSWWKINKETGVILYEWLKTEPEQRDSLKTKWITMINMIRISHEFEKSIYNNIDSNTYENKCTRMTEYYNEETRQHCSTQNGIHMIQNSDIPTKEDGEETY